MSICRTLVFVTCLVVFLGGQVTSAQGQLVVRNSSSNDLFENVEQKVHALMKEQNLPGAAVVIVKNGKTIFKRGFGLANVEQESAVDPDETIFRIGSISKALTLLTLARLADDERVDLEDDVEKYFDGIANPSKFRDPVRIRDLLTHTTGFDQIGVGRHVRFFEQTLGQRKSARPSISAFLKSNNLRRVSPAGSYFRYDTYGATLAGAILERVTDLPYAEAMTQEMFVPLGMSRSSVEVDSVNMNDLAIGYGFVNEAFVPQPYEVYVTTPASSIDATPADMGRLLESLTGGGKSESGRFLTKAMAAAAVSSQFRPHPEFPGMTIGLKEAFIGRGKFSKPVTWVGHGGSMLGFSALMAIIPSENVGVFVVTNRNREAGGGRTTIGQEVFETVIENLQLSPGDPISIPDRGTEQELEEYVGNYYYGVYCHSCTPQELSTGGWRRGPVRSVIQREGLLVIGDDEFLPRRSDVFVQSDGQRMIFFGRDANKKVSHFVYSSSVDTFERVE